MSIKNVLEKHGVFLNSENANFEIRDLTGAGGETITTEAIFNDTNAGREALAKPWEKVAQHVSTIGNGKFSELVKTLMSVEKDLSIEEKIVSAIVFHHYSERLVLEEVTSEEGWTQTLLNYHYLSENELEEKKEEVKTFFELMIGEFHLEGPKVLLETGSKVLHTETAAAIKTFPMPAAWKRRDQSWALGKTITILTQAPTTPYLQPDFRVASVSLAKAINQHLHLPFIENVEPLSPQVEEIYRTLKDETAGLSMTEVLKAALELESKRE